ncbi:MAG: GNAT family N-acetyltransferase [Rickettsiaceae bacterium]|nr:GNAT family N-acetyltransferase [Rickettsiaceae bacterium]
MYDTLILEEHRGQGIATYMMKYLINFCQQKSYQTSWFVYF